MAVIGSAEVEVRANTSKFESDVKKLAGAGGQANTVFTKFQGIVSKAEGALTKLGVSSQDVAVILGAGLAGGAAFAAREVLRFAIDSVQAAARLEDARNLTRRVFEDEADDVEEFAERSGAAIGLSERAALAAVSSFGLFAKNLGLPVEAAADLSKSLTTLASDIASAQPDFVNIEDVLVALRAALRGERDPLERFGVTLTDQAVKAKAVALGIAEAGKELSATQKIVASYGVILEQTQDIQGDFADTAGSLPNTMNSFSAAVEDLQASLGSFLLPTVTEGVTVLSDLATIVGSLVGGIHDLAGVADELGPVGDALGKVIDFVTGATAREALHDLAEALGGAKDATEELTSAEDLAKESAEALAKAEAKTTEELERQSDARKRLVRAIGDAERRVDRAETTLARAFEDSELRIDKAERGLAEAFEDRSERIADAEGRLADERLQAFRSVRDARENLADFERDSAERVEDAERNLTKARQDRTKAIQEARFALESAMRAGDAEAENEARRRLKDAADSTQVNDAQRRLAEEKAERDREGVRLERELAEARVDAAKEVRDAQIDLARVYDDTAEKIVDAERDIADAHRDSSRSISDAQRGVEDAMRDGAEAVDDASTALERLANDAEVARTALQLLRKEAERVADILLDPVFVGKDVPKGSLADILLDPEFRDEGGGMKAGNPYITSEGGPELIIPNSNSTVVSNDQLVKVLRQMVEGRATGPGAVNVVVNHNDPVVFANALSYELARMVN